jgi:hypothetical protein
VDNLRYDFCTNCSIIVNVPVSTVRNLSYSKDHPEYISDGIRAFYFRFELLIIINVPGSATVIKHMHRLVTTNLRYRYYRIDTYFFGSRWNRDCICIYPVVSWMFGTTYIPPNQCFLKI